jgi:Trk K+ transport system NAD-binding subunit/ubiquinone/menaquinone biosynthesis C-methylase UbiE
VSGDRGARVVRYLRARWRFFWIVTRGFRIEIVFAFTTILLSGWLIHCYHPGERRDPEDDHGPQVGFSRSVHAALALLAIQPELAYPEPAVGKPTPPSIRILQFLWFALPIVGVTVVAETLVRLSMTVFNREQGREEWQVAVAETMKDHTIVIGFGRIGYRVVGQLAPRDARIVVVENDPKDEFKEVLEKHDIPMIVGDARRDDVLAKANVSRAKTVLVLTNNDLVNIEVALNAREQNPTIKVIVRMFDEHLAERIERAFDFQAVFSTTALAAPSFAAAVWNQKILHSMSVGDAHLHLARFDVVSGSSIIGLTIAQVEARHAVNILLHQREGQKDLLPAAGNVISPHDALYLVGALEGIDQFDKLAAGAQSSRGRWRRFSPSDDARALLRRKIETYYDELGDGVEKGERYQSVAKTRALELLDARPGHKVLEVGIGTGLLLGRLATKLGDTRDAVGVDVSEGMLRRTKVRLQAQPQGAPHLVRGTATRLGFRDESFDRVVSTYLLDLLEEEDVLIALSEMRRVAKTGGLIVCAGLTARGASPTARLVARTYTIARRIHPLLVGGCRPLDLEPLARRAGLRVVAREVVQQKGRASEIVCCSK